MEELETSREGASPEAEETAKPPGGAAEAPAEPFAETPAGPAGNAAPEAESEETPAGPAGNAAPEAASAETPAGPAGNAAPEAESEETPAAEPTEAGPTQASPALEISVDQLLDSGEPAPAAGAGEDARLRAVLEAIVYVAEEPLTLPQIAAALAQPQERIAARFAELVAEFEKPEHGVAIREVAGGYKMATKPEHHEAVRTFVKSLKPPLKLSLPALETLAVIAYKQPVTSPEVMEIRGVQGAGVLKTLLDRKLIAAAGRKNVIGKPILYKTTREFLIQFGLKDLSELPSLKEFEEIRRLALSDSEPPAEVAEQPAAESADLPEPQLIAPAAETAPEVADDAATGAAPEAAPGAEEAPPAVPEVNAGGEAQPPAAPEAEAPPPAEET